MERRMRATGGQSRESRVESRKGAGRLVSTFDFRLSIFVLIGLALSSTGCPVIDNRAAPGQRLCLQDPQLKRAYQLYVPTQYYDQRRWPLVVTCHGTPPFASASLQLDEWKGLAEQKGVLVASP